MPGHADTQAPPILIVTGPTASGKSGYALQHAQTCDGVIINADALQIYAALPVLTAQPSAADQALVPHRLYNELPPVEACSAALWRTRATDAIREAQAQDRTPLIVGGTGFYIKALQDGLSPVPDVDPVIRADAMATQRRLGNPGFHAHLADRDPVMAARLHPQDTQRLIRAYEVWAATGKSLAHWQSLPPAGPPEGLRFAVHVIMPDRTTLYDRCNQRFESMMTTGALEEVTALSNAIDDGHIPEDAPITKALGFKPLRAYLQGQISKAEAIERAQADTRHYAKRQTTWCRNQFADARFVAL